MQAGSLRHRITITDPTVTGQDSFGQDIIVPTEVGTFWCLVEALQGREKEAAQQRWAEARYRIKMRHQAGITFKAIMTGEWNGLTLDILDVEDARSTLRPDLVMIARDHEEAI